MNVRILAAMTLVSVGIIAGCGSSGTNTTTAIPGKVADGYLANATVFLDKNGNYQLDSDEPSAVTDTNGAYILNIDPADVGRYPILALATKGATIDNDTGTAVTSSYVLSMPKGSVTGAVNSNFISPMSTQIREMMETGTYGSTPLAMEALRIKLGMPVGTNVMADYMAVNNTAMHSAAQNMARLMGGQMPQVMAASGSTTVVDVNRYRGMMGTIFSNMSSVKVRNAAMTDLMATMTTTLSAMPATGAGMPYRNMSTAFRGMMNGVSMMGR